MFKTGDTVLWKTLGTLHRVVPKRNLDGSLYIRSPNEFSEWHCNQNAEDFLLIYRDGKLVESVGVEVEKEDINILSTVFEQCRDVQAARSPVSIMLKVGEEVGELSTEVAVQAGLSYKKAGSDGVLGESADVMIAIIDLVYKSGYSQKQLEDMMELKLGKWRDKCTTI